MPSLRDQLVGAWELIEFCEYLPNDESDKIFPMGSTAQGIIMYTPDGYMSAQLQASEDQPEHQKSFMSSYLAYTGRFYLNESGDELGPVLLHEMRNTNLKILLGQTQRRFMKIVDEADGQFLVLGAGQQTQDKEKRITRVRWKRLPENQKTSPSKKPS